MQAIIGSYEEDGQTVAVRCALKYLARPARCFNCNQPIAVEQERWDAAYGAGNDVGLDLRVELWALPAGLPLERFSEDACQLISRYTARRGAATIRGLPSAVAPRDRIWTDAERMRAQLRAALKAEGAVLKRQRDLAAVLAKAQPVAGAAELLKELE